MTRWGFGLLWAWLAKQANSNHNPPSSARTQPTHVTTMSAGLMMRISLAMNWNMNYINFVHFFLWSILIDISKPPPLQSFGLTANQVQTRSASHISQPYLLCNTLQTGFLTYCHTLQYSRGEQFCIYFAFYANYNVTRCKFSCLLLVVKYATYLFLRAI